MIQPVVFGGPSLSDERSAHFTWRPPAVRGDFDALADATVVYIDSYMWQCPTLTHVEILAFLRRGGTLIGASSAGALRAVELRNCGAIGVGYVYGAILSGRIVDDGELLAAVDVDTLRPLTVPLVDVRHLLALMRGALRHDLLLRMLDVARRLYFMERTRYVLLKEWNILDSDACRIAAQILATKGWSIKEKDSNLALKFARARMKDSHALPDPLPCRLDDVLVLD